MAISVIKADGTKGSNVNLPETIFGIEPNEAGTVLAGVAVVCASNVFSSKLTPNGAASATPRDFLKKLRRPKFVFRA